MLEYGETEVATVASTRDALDRLTAYFRILFEWEARLTAGTVDPATNDGRHDEVTDRGVVLPGVVEGPGA